MTDAQAASHAVVQKLREWSPAAVAETAEFRGELTVVVPREHLLAAAEFLCNDAELAFTFLSDLSGVDRYPLEPRFEVNYHLVSMKRRERLRLKVKVGGVNPAAPSVAAVWPTADWHEREVWDLLGVRFDGHPDLRRILMPEDWEGHPLRKDFPVTGYR